MALLPSSDPLAETPAKSCWACSFPTEESKIIGTLRGVGGGGVGGLNAHNKDLIRPI